jgi:hypothetical protein
LSFIFTIFCCLWIFSHISNENSPIEKYPSLYVSMYRVILLFSAVCMCFKSDAIHKEGCMCPGKPVLSQADFSVLCWRETCSLSCVDILQLAGIMCTVQWAVGGMNDCGFVVVFTPDSCRKLIYHIKFRHKVSTKALLELSAFRIGFLYKWSGNLLCGLRNFIRTIFKFCLIVPELSHGKQHNVMKTTVGYNLCILISFGR